MQTLTFSCMPYEKSEFAKYGTKRKKEKKGKSWQQWRSGFGSKDLQSLQRSIPAKRKLIARPKRRGNEIGRSALSPSPPPLLLRQKAHWLRKSNAFFCLRQKLQWKWSNSLVWRSFFSFLQLQKRDPLTYFFSLVLLAVRRNNFGQFPKMGRTTHSAFSFLEKIMRVFKKNKGEGSEGQQRIFHKFPSFSRPGVTDSRRKPSRVFSKFRTSQQFFISHHHKFVGLIHNLPPPPNFPKTKTPKQTPPKTAFYILFFSTQHVNSRIRTQARKIRHGILYSRLC